MVNHSRIRRIQILRIGLRDQRGPVINQGLNPQQGHFLMIINFIDQVEKLVPEIFQLNHQLIENLFIQGPILLSILRLIKNQKSLEFETSP